MKLPQGLISLMEETPALKTTAWQNYKVLARY